MRHPLAIDQHVTHKRAVEDVGVGVADTRRGGTNRDRKASLRAYGFSIRFIAFLIKYRGNAPVGSDPHRVEKLLLRRLPAPQSR